MQVSAMEKDGVRNYWWAGVGGLRLLYLHHYWAPLVCVCIINSPVHSQYLHTVLWEPVVISCVYCWRHAWVIPLKQTCEWEEACHRGGQTWDKSIDRIDVKRFELREADTFSKWVNPKSTKFLNNTLLTVEEDDHRRRNKPTNDAISINQKYFLHFSDSVNIF